jgi:hypothetical protein
MPGYGGRQGGPAIPAFRGKHFQHLTFVIDGPPKIVHLAVDLHEHFVEVPAPLRNGT